MSYPSDAVPSLYDAHAPWYHLLTAPSEYVEEAQYVMATLSQAAPVSTMLELGSGGGNLASHVPSTIGLTLSDLSPKMLELSATINPGRQHIAGDMRTLKLGRLFDAVLVHDAIDYMLTVEDLQQVARTVRAHLRPGGVALLMPDHVRETFAPSTGHGGHDEDSGRGLRYLEWSWDPDPTDATTEVDFACILREANGATHVVHDRHRFGLFPRSTWLDVFANAELSPQCVTDPWEREVFICRAPS